MIGQTLSHYRLTEELGAGGMGVVYRARDTTLDRDVALKLLHPDAVGSDTAVQRFRREALALSRLNHPHVCTIHEIGEADGRTFIVMEMVRGRALREAIPTGGLPLETAARYGMEIASALAHAHANGIVHRDLKTANVVVTEQGDVKVLDFGLSRRTDPGVDSSEQTWTGLTQPGSVAGTPAYLAPECWLGGQADERSDIWAVGVVLYEMAAGERPFLGASTAELATAIVKEPPAPLKRPLPKGFHRIIERCLDKNPARRFGSAAEVRAALEAVSGTDVALSAPPSRRRPSLAWPAAAAVVAALVGGAWALGVWPFTKDAEPPGTRTIDSVAVLPFADMSAAQDQAYFADGVAEELLTALARIPGLKVAGRASSFQFRGDPNVREIGEKLAVQAVLEGGVRKEGDRVRITARLLDCREGFQLWSESYTRTASEVIATQEDIAREIARALGTRLTGGELEAAVESQDTTPEVYDLYLRGRHLSSRGYDLEALERAVALFRQAIDRDPTYAPAWAGIAWTYLAMQISVPTSEVKVVLLRARAATERALELDETLVDAKVARAKLLAIDRRHDEAVRECESLLKRNSGNADVVSTCADILTTTPGRQEDAVRANRRAVELDPLSVDCQRNLVAALAFAGRTREVVEEGEKLRGLDPANMEAPFFIGMALSELGESEKAIAILRELAESAPEQPYARTALANAYARAGDRETALRVIADARADKVGVPLKEIAYVHVALGEHDRAFEYLGRAVEEEPETLWWIDTDPDAAPLRSDPRWEALLERIDRLPPAE